MSGPGLGYEILGAVKVKDGLFIGDELAAQDLEFVVANKVTRVINCCGRQVPNHWEPIGVIYLTYFWVDADNQIVLDPRDVVANEIFRFIEEALEGAESVLIHSVRGQSRSCCVLSAYMMKKYNWGLRKTMEFLSSRRPDLNLKPSFLQQLSGYERRLMAQSKQNFSLDWHDADFTRLESEELLLRNTYINSQMGPLAEFHAADIGQGKPRKLLWADNNVDDKIRLEKPAGADRHNLNSCSRNQLGQPVLKSVLKSPKHRSHNPAHKGTAEQQSLLSRPTTASSENPQEARPQSWGSAPVAAPEAPGAPLTSASGPLGTSILGQPLVGNTGSGISAAPMGLQQQQQQQQQLQQQQQQQAPYQPSSQEAPPNAVPSYTYAQNVPTAWGADSVASASSGYAPAPGGPAHVDEYGRFAGPYPSLDQQGGMPPGYQGAPGSAFLQPRGPANIRDSLSGLGRSRDQAPDPSRSGPRDSIPVSRDKLRDPSPNASAKRNDSPLAYRGESPLRLLNRSGRGNSPGQQPGSADRSRQPPNTGGYNPQLGNLGFCLGGIRPGQQGGGVGPAQRTGGPQPAGPGMGAFRSGGPVRAKADLLGEGNRPPPRSRPATAPQQRASSGSRPASPLGGGRASGSRPSSPQTRPPSPTTSQQQRGSGVGPSQGVSMGPMPQPGYPNTQIDKTKQRSLSSHMRRAPSPTPAFNRNASPSRPRWRS